MKDRKLVLYILRSRVGWAGAFLQLVWLMWISWAYGPILGEQFHFINEPLLTKLFILLNFPALVVSGFALNPLVFLMLGLDIRDRSHLDLELALFILTIVVQWNLIGAVIQYLAERFSRKRSPTHEL